MRFNMSFFILVVTLSTSNILFEKVSLAQDYQLAGNPQQIVREACSKVIENLSEVHDRFRPKERDGKHPKLFSEENKQFVENSCLKMGTQYVTKFQRDLRGATALNRDKWYLGLMKYMCNTAGIPNTDPIASSRPSSMNRNDFILSTRTDCKTVISHQVSENLKKYIRHLRDDLCAARKQQIKDKIKKDYLQRSDFEILQNEFSADTAFDQCLMEEIIKNGNQALDDLYRTGGSSNSSDGSSNAGAGNIE